jgi:hypothetical protein
MMFLVVPFMKHAGMALYPFILINKNELKKDAVLIRHEQIHLRQQLELLVLPFYLAYLICYLYNLCCFRDHHTAYLQIPFEREAYQHEAKPDYLAKRQFWAWLRG